MRWGQDCMGTQSRNMGSGAAEPATTCPIEIGGRSGIRGENRPDAFTFRADRTSDGILSCRTNARMLVILTGLRCPSINPHSSLCP